MDKILLMTFLWYSFDICSCTTKNGFQLPFNKQDSINFTELFDNNTFLKDGEWKWNQDSFYNASNKMEMHLSVSAVISDENKDMLIQINWDSLFLIPNVLNSIALYQSDEGRNEMLFLINVTDSYGSILTKLQFQPYQSPNEPTRYFLVYFTDYKVCSINAHINYGRWMKRLRSIIGSQLLSKVALLGTHNSGAIATFLGTQSFLSKWFFDLYQCQRLSIYLQLVHGVRYLDIRVKIDSGADNVQEKYFIHHEIKTITLFEVLSDVKRFVEETDELVVLDFHSITSFSISNHADLIDDLHKFVLQELEPYLYCTETTPTLNQVWRAKRNIILASTDLVFRNLTKCLNIEQVWANEGDVIPVLDYFEEYFSTIGRNSHIISANIEVTRNYFKHPAIGLRQYANEINGFFDFILQKPIWKDKLNILSLDFFLSANAMTRIYDINYYRFSNNK